MMSSTTSLNLLDELVVPDVDHLRIANHVRAEYGLEGEWRKLHGEREQNLCLRCADGRSLAVKIAGSGQDPAVLEFQCRALLHIAETDPTLPVPRMYPTGAGELMSTITDETGASYRLRVLTFLDGEPIVDRGLDRPGSLGEVECGAIGQAHGRLARALQGFTHPSATHPMVWDLANGLMLDPQLLRFLPEELAVATAPVLDRLSRNTLPNLRRLRSQVIHNDVHEANILANTAGPLRILGIIDFGDLIYGALAQDLAVSIASFVHWGSDPLRAASALVRGFHQVNALQEDDFGVLLDLALARMILQVLIGEYQSRVQGKPRPDLELLKDAYCRTVLDWSRVSPDEAADVWLRACQQRPCSPLARPARTGSASRATLLERRRSVLGNAYLFYDEPLHLVRGAGTRLYDAQGREYLDCYNNVAAVGHCHPEVVRALATQAATLNTSSRYLDEGIIALAERLKETLPSGLDTFFFVCTGSEANDLATRIARRITGRRGMLVHEDAYHGNTELVTDLSPLEYAKERQPDWLATLPAPNLYRGRYRMESNDAGERYASHVEPAIARLTAAGHGSAGLLVDSIFDANGVLVPPADYLALAFDAARGLGALCIADEVQVGFGRSGTDMWGFEAFGVIPDIVTMGKPMGNGHPIAAVVTRREIAQAFQKSVGYFNTFGGNPVSGAVANAVLDVLESEKLQERALDVGRYLGAGLRGLMDEHEVIGHVHGRGLFYGVDLVSDRQTRAPSRLAARWVRERMKQNGVLIASTGPLGNVLKIRPPLTFTRDDASLCLTVLNEALRSLPRQSR